MSSPAERRLYLRKRHQKDVRAIGALYAILKLQDVSHDEVRERSRALVKLIRREANAIIGVYREAYEPRSAEELKVAANLGITLDDAEDVDEFPMIPAVRVEEFRRKLGRIRGEERGKRRRPVMGRARGPGNAE